MIITEAYGISRVNSFSSHNTKAKNDKHVPSSLLEKIASLVKRLISCFRPETSAKESLIAYESMIEKFKGEGREAPSISKSDFTEIFNAYTKKQLKSSGSSNIVRSVKGKQLARPVLVSENGPFILFTKLSSCSDPFVGKGTDSTVKLAYNLKNHTVEALTISKDNNFEDSRENRSELERPVFIMKKVGEAFAPKVHACAIEKWNKDETSGLKRYVVNTLYQNALSKLPKGIDNKLKLDAFEQILKILIGLQEKGIVHSDVKPANFVYRKTDKGIEVKQIDNDRSFDIQKNNPKKELGSLFFSAPEVLQDPSNQSHIADVYSAMMTIMDIWYPGMYKKLLDEIDLALEGDIESIRTLCPEFKTVNETKLKQFAGLLCLKPGWFCPAKEDVLGQILKKGLDPDPKKRQSADLLLLEIEERREKILASAEKRAEAVFAPIFKISYLNIKRAFRNAIKSNNS